MTPNTWQVPAPHPSLHLHRPATGMSLPPGLSALGQSPSQSCAVPPPPSAVDHFLFGHQGLLSLLELLLEILQLQSLDGGQELTEPHPAQLWRPRAPPPGQPLLLGRRTKRNQRRGILQGTGKAEEAGETTGVTWHNLPQADIPS